MKQNYVIFVDDEKALHDIVRYSFKDEVRAGHFILECFENGKLCYEYVKEQLDNINIIIIISDIRMPVMDGFELADKLRTEFPGLRFSITSANTDKKTIEKAFSAGASEFYKKPIDFEKMKGDIFNLLS